MTGTLSIKLQVVDEFSARLNLPHETCRSLNVDHRDICKFSGHNDPNYITLARFLADIVRKIRRLGVYCAALDLLMRGSIQASGRPIFVCRSWRGAFISTHCYAAHGNPVDKSYNRKKCNSLYTYLSSTLASSKGPWIIKRSGF